MHRQKSHNIRPGWLIYTLSINHSIRTRCVCFQSPVSQSHAVRIMHESTNPPATYNALHVSHWYVFAPHPQCYQMMNQYCAALSDSWCTTSIWPAACELRRFFFNFLILIANVSARNKLYRHALSLCFASDDVCFTGVFRAKWWTSH